MVILAAMVAVAIPYATRSKKGLVLDQLCSDLAEMAKFAVDRAAQRGDTLRLVVDMAASRCSLEKASASAEGIEFIPLQEGGLETHPFDREIRLVHIQGFEALDQNRHGLTFDPAQPWPQATLSLGYAGQQRTLQIEGRRVYLDPCEAQGEGLAR